jgi:hypothetical protein
MICAGSSYRTGQVQPLEIVSLVSDGLPDCEQASPRICARTLCIDGLGIVL